MALKGGQVQIQEANRRKNAQNATAGLVAQDAFSRQRSAMNAVGRNAQRLGNLSNMNQGRSGLLFGQTKRNFFPIMGQLPSLVNVNPAFESARAVGGVSDQFDRARATQAREMSRMGIDPSSGRFQGLDQQSRLDEAAARSYAGQSAHESAQQRRLANAMAASQLGLQVGAQATQAAGLAANAANAAAVVEAQRAGMEGLLAHEAARAQRALGNVGFDADPKNNNVIDNRERIARDQRAKNAQRHYEAKRAAQRAAQRRRQEAAQIDPRTQYSSPIDTTLAGTWGGLDQIAAGIASAGSLEPSPSWVNEASSDGNPNSPGVPTRAAQAAFGADAGVGAGNLYTPRIVASTEEHLTDLQSKLEGGNEPQVRKYLIRSLQEYQKSHRIPRNQDAIDTFETGELLEMYANFMRAE